MDKPIAQITSSLAFKIFFLLTTLLLSQCVDTMKSTEHKMTGPEESAQKINLSGTPGSRKYPKMSSSLNQLVEAYRVGGMSAAEAFAKERLIVIDKNRVQVTIMATEGTVDELRTAVERTGGAYQLHFKNRLQALVPIEALEGLVQRPELLRVREPRRAVPE